MNSVIRGAAVPRLDLPAFPVVASVIVDRLCGLVGLALLILVGLPRLLTLSGVENGLFVAMAAINALCIAIFVALAALMGPLLAGIAAFLLIGAVAAVMAWVGYSRLRDAL